MGAAPTRRIAPLPWPETVTCWALMDEPDVISSTPPARLNTGLSCSTLELPCHTSPTLIRQVHAVFKNQPPPFHNNI